MALDRFRVQVGYEIEDQASLTYGTTAPSGGAGVAEPEGSIQVVLEGGVGKLFLKEGSADTSWVQQASQTYVDDAVAGVVAGTRWRTELPVVAATGDAAPAEGATVASFTPFTDDDAAGVTLALNDYVLFGVGGTGVLGRVYDDGGLKITFLSGNVTAADAGDLFLVDAWLPDSSGQENQAIGLFTTATNLIKFTDIDFGLTTGITVASPFTPASGNPAAGDTLHALLQKLDGNDDAMLQVLGVSQGDTNLGAFTVSSGAAEIIGATASVKSAFQSIGDEIGTAVSAGVRTNNPVSDQAVNRNIEALDAAIGIDSQLTPLTRTVGALVINSTVMSKFDALDLVIGADADLTAQARTTGSVSLSANIYANIDAVDLAIGPDTTPVTRTNNPIVIANTSNANIDALDAAIGADADITSTNWLTAGAGTVYSKLNQLDDGIGKVINKFSTTGVAAGTNTVLLTIPLADFEGGTFFVYMESSGNSQYAAMNVVSNGTITDDTVYGDIRTGPFVFKQLETDINGGNVRVIADIQSAATDVSITYVRTLV